MERIIIKFFLSYYNIFFMKKTNLTKEEIIANWVAQCTTFEDVQNYVKWLVWPMVEKMLEWEMESHLWYKKNAIDGINTWNSRNWNYNKWLMTGWWKIDISVPRDRNWEFKPQIVKKYSGTTNDVEEKIISMYALWLSTRDIQWHIKDIYWADISADTVSSITDKVLPEIEEWRQKPLDSCYPIIFLDAVHYKVKDNGKYVTKAVYVVLWYNIKWYKEVLWIYIWEAESSKFRQLVCNDISNRWVKDVMIACIDWLKGFSTAIKNIFPEIEVQRCIIHQIRYSMRYISSDDTKPFMRDLKEIYKAHSLELAEQNLVKLEEKRWKTYPISVNSWKNNWAELSTYFVYPEKIRKIIYTTNIIEWYNRQLRKVTKTTNVFPSEKSLMKLLYLAQNNIAKKRKTPVAHWGQILWQLQSFFPKIDTYLD